MTTANTNPNNPSLLDRVEGFFKGTTKKSSTPSLTSSLEHLHTSQHAQADAEAQHQAALMSGMPPGMPEGTQSLSSETLPQPMPRQVLNEVLNAGGHVPHAHHVDVDKVEQQHEQAVGPLGHVQKEPGLLDKAKLAIDSLTGKSTTTSTQPIQHHPNIPHSVLPDATLKQVQTAHGHPPHAHHVDVGTVEQRHDQNLGLGHVQQEPSVLEKMSNKLQELIPPTTFSSTTTTEPTIHTHANIPHAAVSDQVLEDVQSQKGKVPHAHHVDVGKVEAQHEQAVGPLGTVLKEPTLLDKVASKIQGLVYPQATPTTTSTITIQSHPNIPHSALSNQTLRDIQAQRGHVPHAHHVDIKSVEQKYEQSLGLGRVHGPSTVLLNKAKLAVDKVTGKSVAPLMDRPIRQHPYIPHAALSDAVLQQLHNAHGRPYRARHVDIDAVERAQEQRMIAAVGPLGRVQKGPNLFDKLGNKIQSLTSTTAPTTLTQDIESQRGKVPHAHHVDVGKVEQQHEQAVGPLGHVQEPSLLDKAKNMISTITGKTPITAQPIQQHPHIPHSALSDATLQQIHNAHGHPVQARHVDIDAVERAQEQRMIAAVGPLGRVQKGPGLFDKMGNKIQSLVQPSTAPTTLTQDIEKQRGKVPHAHHVDIAQVEKQYEQAVGPLGHVQKEPTLLEKMGDKLQDMINRPTTTTIPLTSTTTQHSNIPHAAVPDQVLRDVESPKGEVPHAHHVDLGPIEQRHEQAIGPLGHVQKEPTLMDKAKLAVGLGDTAAMSKPTTTTAPVDQHSNIPHAAVPDQVLKDIESQKGKVPHAHHVDLDQVEHRHDQAVGPLGHVQKEPTLLDKAKNAVGLGDAPSTSTSRPTTTTTLPVDQHSNIPHAAVPDQVLKDVQHQKGKVPHAHHVDIDKVEQRHDQAVGPLGHVQKEPTLMDKAKHAVGLGDTPSTTTSRPTTTSTQADLHPSIPHAAVPDQVLKDVQHQKGKVPHAHHVDIDKVEQHHDQAVGPLGHVQKDPTLLDKAKHAVGLGDAPSTSTSKPTTTTTTTQDDPHHRIPHAAVPDQVLKDVQHQKGKVPHAHHVDIAKVEQHHDEAVGPLGHVQKEPGLLDKAKHALGMDKSKVTTPTTTTPTRTEDLPSHHQRTNAGFIGAAPAEPPAQLSDVPVEPMVAPTAQRQPTLLDKIEYSVFGVEPIKAAPVAAAPTTATASAAPSTTTPATTQHANIPHAAVSDQVLKDVQHQKGKVPHAHHVDIGKVEAQHDEAVGPLGHVQKEPGLLDKAKHALGLDKSKDTTKDKDITTKDLSNKDKAPLPAAEPRPNIMHNSLPSYVMSDIKDAHGQVPHAHHIDLNEQEMERSRRLALQDSIGHVLEDKTQPNIMHNSLPTRVMNELKDQHGHVPNAQHVDMNQVEHDRDQQLAQHGLIGRVVDPSQRPNIMHNSLPTRVLNDIESSEGQVPNAHHVDTTRMERDRDRNLSQQHDIGRVMDGSSSTQPNIMHNSLPTRVMRDVKDAQGHVPHAHHVDINQLEHDRDQRLSDSHLRGRVADPSLPGSSTVTHPLERNNSGFTAGGFPSTQQSSTPLPATTAYFKDTGASSGTTSNQPASSLTSDLGYKSGLTGSSSSKPTTSGQSPLVATLPPGANLESASGVRFEPADKLEKPLGTSTTGSTSTTASTLGPNGPKFHEQK